MRGERHRSGAEDARSEADKGDDQQEFQGEHGVVGYLGCDEVEAAGKRDRKAEDGGGPDERVDADEEARGDAPGEGAWGCSHAEEGQDGQDGPAVEPVVMYRCGCGGLLG